MSAGPPSKDDSGDPGEPIALFVRDGDDLRPAPAEDFEVARRYWADADRGEVLDGRRLTLLAARAKYRTGESVRVLHVYEVLVPGHTLYVMGPKAVWGESVDGVLVTPATDPALVYDGEIEASPGVDFNWEITSYSFPDPGTHRIDWRHDDLHSNTLTVEIEAV